MRGQDLLDRLAGHDDLPPTPFYLYDTAMLADRVARLRGVLGGDFALSYAVKANPNLALLGQLAGLVDHIDASSFHEVERALSLGVAPDRITWSGPGKRIRELAAMAGRGVVIVVEALDEIAQLAALCADLPAPQKTILRINPDYVPKGYGASMSGKPSQFGVDQPQAPEAIDAIMAAPGLRLAGFHAYTGSMCLNPAPIAENIANLCAIFRDATAHAGIVPEKLIFGAGFGIPYHDGQDPLDIDAVAAAIAGDMAALRADPVCGQAAHLLELGRWIVGPCGALVTEVLSVKDSRGMRIAVCDAGFNNHLAAAGMMGSVFQKNYPIWPLAPADTAPVTHLLAGPLCTSIDLLARKIDLPPLARGDRLAVLLSGAYGLTASPTRFISHPEPREYALSPGGLRDITESALNHPGALVAGLATP